MPLSFLRRICYTGCSNQIREEHTLNIYKKKYTKGILVFCTVLALLAGACGIYLGDYYRADMEAIEAFMPQNTIEIYESGKHQLVFQPDDPVAGFIFYPGGKVEYTAYTPLMEALASEGILCVLVRMPGNLAVLDMDAAAGIPEQFPEIDTWYIGGHSLGGSMAASYLAKHTDAYEGLILLGSYSTADLADTGLSVLSIYGSEDQVMNREKYEQYRNNLPADFTEVILEGGCHAYFGMYGNQDGDGTPVLTPKDQVYQTAEAVISMIARSES